VLRQLTIHNLALVDRIELELGPGLNVLSGETGAGKSVLVNALSLVLGARASTDAIRAGASEASVEAMFELSRRDVARLSELGIETEDGELVVRRTISAKGKGRVLLNGQMATVSMLAGALRGVVDVTSQHEHTSLLDGETHLDLVDAFGDLLPRRSKVEDAHAQVLAYREALEGLSRDEAERARREDYLRFSVDEIDAIAPRPGELQDLEARRSRLRNAAELADGVRRAEGALYSEDGAMVEVLGRVGRDLSRLSSLDDRLAPLSGVASSLLSELEELARELGRYSGALSADPQSLEQIDDRIQQLEKLRRKHGGSIESVLAARKQMAAELEDLENEEARRGDLSSLLEAAVDEERRLGLELSAARHGVVRSLERAVAKELEDLSMKSTRLAVELVHLDEPGPRGQETAEIRIAPNAGEPLRALAKIASGGELSRVLLAMKRVLADRTPVSTFVFDEIDTGIGGAVADVLGAKLASAAGSAQILCVTHLPQIAAHAEHHFSVSKREREGRTVTEVLALDDRSRVEELARMLGGVEITDKTRSLAAEMLFGRKAGNGHARGRARRPAG
jgi:DNA repair protein RecN (Recombination protein N)